MKKAFINSALLGVALIAPQADAIELDGFLTAGLAVHNQTQADGSKVTYLDEVTDDVTFLQDSKFGLQITADIVEDMQVVAQLLASAVDENYRVDIEWAYLDYAVGESTNIRAGRIKQPVFLISDYLEVGYAYPWIRPPAEAYSNMPVDSIIGVQLLYQANFGGMTFGVQPYFGSNSEAVPGVSSVEFFANNYVGMALRLENRSFTFQVSSFQTDVSTIDTGSGIGRFNSEGSAVLSVVSLSWDIANFVGYTEYTTRDIKADQDTLGQGFNQAPFDSLFSDQDGGYVTLGYRMGKFLPHLTFATIDSDPAGAYICGSPTDTSTCGPRQGARQDSVTLGLRYELNESAALKIEYQQVKLEDNVGNYGLYQPFSLGDPLNSQTALSEDKASLISVAIDVIF
ncbi:MAG TPA: porin [Gammaproteobacteria bacterium]|nr:porin [Gammaproteobacteria bacterium]